MESKQLKKTILLVDDDPVFLKGMMYTVRSLGFEPILATGGHNAITFLEHGHADVIVSDINMPEGNGLQLLDHVLKTKKTPVILMTGLSDLKEAKAALSMGAKFFLSKPFKKDELKAAIDNCIANADLDLAGVNDRMIKLHLEEFLAGESLNFPLHLNINDVVVKISNGGESLSPERVTSYRDNDIDSLHVFRNDLINYLGVSSAPKTVLVDKEKITSSALKASEHFDYLYRLNPESYKRALLHVELAIDVLLENDISAKAMKKLHADTELFDKSVHVALFTSLIAQYAGTFTIKDFFYLVAGSLFHDYGLMERGHRNIHGDMKDLPEFERNIVLTHPEKASKLLKSFGYFPEEILLMVEQHHESEDGAGYPHNLPGVFTGQKAKILIVADNFAHEAHHHGKSLDECFELVSKFTVKGIKKYDTKILEALALAFKQSLPEEFVTHQLNMFLEVKEAV